MSGQPYKTPLDISKTRKAYLANLKLRAELDDKNLQANKTYIRTGQLPTEPTDTRTLTEKLADVERLKIDIQRKLLEITDGREANNIVNNLSPEQLVFLSQNFGPIRDQMQRSYSLGVQSDIFIDFLNRYIEKYNITKGVDFGLQQGSANQILANQQTIIENLPDTKIIQALRELIGQVEGVNNPLSNRVLQNLAELQGMINEIPQILERSRQTDNDILSERILQMINNVAEQMPSKQDLISLYDALIKRIEAGDARAINTELRNVDNKTSFDPDTRDVIEIAQNLSEAIPTTATIGQPVQTIEATAQQLGPKETALLEKLKKLNNDIIRDYKNSENLQPDTKAVKIEYIKKMYEYIKNEENMPALTTYIKNISKDKNLSALNSEELNKVIKDLNEKILKKLVTIRNNIDKLEGVIESTTFEQLKYTYGQGMKGRGITRIRPSQVFESDIDYNIGIQQSPKFAPIGRYLINKRQLDKDIIAIKRKAGSTIPNLPSQRVSRNLGGIIRKIIGGSLPSFDELNNLSDEERIFLDKIAKETRIEGRLSIPTPKKDEDEKDINQFEILKGQILSGNDNPDLVKKFKTILLKLSRKDLIPKIQVKELLLDLATLGH